MTPDPHHDRADTLRIGLVGAGAIAEPHVRAWQILGADVTVHSRRPPTEFAERHGIRVARSLRALVAECDIVDVCSPTPTHAEVVRVALASRRQVVCEKPLARTAVAAQALVDEAAAAGVLLFAAHVVRYFPAYEELHRRLKAGEVGEVSSAAFTRRVAAPPDDSWFHDLGQSGGVVLDLMLHDLDQALWQFGPVRTLTAERIGPGDRRVRATLSHEAGVTTTVEAQWGPPDTAFATSYAVHGSRGAVTWDSRAVDADGPVSRDVESPYLVQLRNVLDHLRTGRPTRVSPDDGVAAVALAERVLAALGTP
ncbi:Gfo/Idh/MocA family protein [Pedococcus bigeumensis]|uniref:Gfo/Idh/MocA family protein n=1 Tax=Pedococcus bigeumensis TaxID=433644 RepID=UPI001386D346|nr:Gfo/Idh/MocA family oxidoreductase [Pedococcus bigeumensis]